MGQLQMQVDLAVPRAAVDALLAARPTTWLRRFLLLATVSTVPGTGPGWYRLGPVAGDDPTVVPLTWRPRAGPRTMDLFRGALEVSGDAARSTIRLRGTATGGAPETNELVLARLLDLIATALVEARGPTGS